jgi:hypothetical protein
MMQHVEIMVAVVVVVVVVVVCENKHTYDERDVMGDGNNEMNVVGVGVAKIL